MMEIMLWMETITVSVLLVTARRVRMMKKEMEKVGGQVKNYLNIVLEGEQEDSSEIDDIKVQGLQKDEEENRIISTVLQEIFP